MESILLGYEVGTGKPVSITPNHLVIAGMTQESGKTTTLEAMLARSKKKALVFKTKPGEKTSFSGGQIVPAFFKEHSDWEYVSQLLEATMKEKMRFERPWIMRVCEGTSNLMQVKRNVDTKLADDKVRGLNRDIYTTLQAYLQKVLPEIQATPLSNTLKLPAQINIMDLERMSDELQSLVIRSAMEVVLKDMQDVVVVMPEAWRIIPQDRGNPCKVAAESFVRQGATNGNLLWIDSQDITGTDKSILKLVSTWILGLQSEKNEVERTLKQMPISGKEKPGVDAVMSLKRGHFYVCRPGLVRLIYVRPAWVSEEDAIAIAKGSKDVASIRKPLMSELPPIPLPATEIPQSRQSADMEAFRKEIDDFRAEIMKQQQDLFSYVKRFVDNHSAVVAPATQVVQVKDYGREIEELKRQILSIERTPGQSPQVNPLEALKKKFLEEAKARLLSMISDLTPEEKKLVMFLEAQQKGCGQKEILEKCYGMSGTSGGNQRTTKERSQKLHGLGLVRRDDRIATTYPNLRELLEGELNTHGATEEEVALVYNHIISEMLK